MASVKPFQALHYHPQKISIGKVVAPPYDVISLDENKKLHDRDPHNVIRLELGVPDPKNPPSDSVYADSAKYLNEWIKNDILIKGPKSAYYLYEMNYQHPFKPQTLKRLALFGALKLEPFENKVVFPHEKTHSTAKVDRMKLLKKAACNFSPIFGLYEDSSKTLDSIYETAKKTKPIYEFEDEKKTVHKLWVLESASEVSSIEKTFSKTGIFIADGHHRYETALNYALEKNGGVISGKNSRDYVLTAFVRFHDPGLLILPIHRVVQNTVSVNKESLIGGLKKYFNVHPASKAEITKAAEGEKVKGFGMAFSEKECYLLELKDESAFSVMPAGKPKSWYSLDMTQVSHLILEPLLNMDSAHLEKTLSYTANTEEAFSLLRDGKSPCVFFVRPLKASVIKEICESDELMPQKSTYFYPKFPSGLLMYQH